MTKAIETRDTFKQKRSFFHPYSGMLIIGLDWLFFGVSSLSLGLSTPVTCVLAFFATFFGVASIQKNLAGDSVPAAFGKGFIGGIFAGIPTAISGTALGALILAMSGLGTKKSTSR